MTKDEREIVSEARGLLTQAFDSNTMVWDLSALIAARRELAKLNTIPPAPRKAKSS